MDYTCTPRERLLLIILVTLLLTLGGGEKDSSASGSRTLLKLGTVLASDTSLAEESVKAPPETEAGDGGGSLLCFDDGSFTSDCRFPKRELFSARNCNRRSRALLARSASYCALGVCTLSPSVLRASFPPEPVRLRLGGGSRMAFCAPYASVDRKAGYGARTDGLCVKASSPPSPVRLRLTGGSRMAPSPPPPPCDPPGKYGCRRIWVKGCALPPSRVGGERGRLEGADRVCSLPRSARLRLGGGDGVAPPCMFEAGSSALW